MTTEEIQTLSDELSTRKLKALVATRVRAFRPTVSDDTIYRAFRIEDFQAATPLIKFVLRTGNTVLAEDNVRISAATMT